MPTELKDEYRKAHFKCERKELPQQFFIITACNPEGITVSDALNDAADLSLRTEIARLGYERFSVIGGNFDFSHAEPGYGLSCNREEALSLTRQFHQDALFEVKNDRVILISAKEDPGPDEEIGSWSDLCRGYV